MSILIKKTDSSSSGSSKGYPVGNVTNVKIKNKFKTVKIQWSDPDDTTVSDNIISTWSRTVLVRKEGSAPLSIKDGNTIVQLNSSDKNKFRDAPYVDDNLHENKTYYYRFFTISTDGVYNNDSSMIYKAIIFNTNYEFSSVLSDNSWENISKASELGIASDIWKIGDEIDIKLSNNGTIAAQTITLQIWDFNHFDKSDGSGKAGICFGMKNLIGDGPRNSISVFGMYKNGYINSGWNDSDMRLEMENTLKTIPTDLQSFIKEVEVFSTWYLYGSTSGSSTTTDKIFIPSYKEIFGAAGLSSQINIESDQKQFPIFTDNNSRKKGVTNEDPYYWWTRSLYYDTRTDADTMKYWSVDQYGEAQLNDGTSYIGLCFCFNV